MKKSRIPFIYPLLLVLVITACGPAAVNQPIANEIVPTATVTQMVDTAVSTQEPIISTSEVLATDNAQPEAMVQPTSRGPNLEASDPSMVNLASGQLQLVEFFRFT
jgi:hypothetical protein